MKLSLFQKLLLYINLGSLLFQLMLMGSIPSLFNFSILNLFVPLMVLFNLLFFVYWLVQIKWPFLLFMGAFLIGYSQWNLLYQFPKNSVHKSASTLSVMSYNVRLFNKYRWLDQSDIPLLIEEMINTHQPDIICFQEYSKSEAPRLEAYEYKYIQPSREMGKSPLAIYSKLPILDQGYIDFQASTNSGAYVEVQFQKQRIRVYNLHFESFRLNKEDSLFTNPDSNALQIKFDEVFRKQLTQIDRFEQVEKLNDVPSIVCTDLNNTQFSRTYARLQKNRQDAFVSAGEGLGETFYFSSFPLRIDFIFADPMFKINAFEVIEQNFSDHFPIIATLGND